MSSQLRSTLTLLLTAVAFLGSSGAAHAQARAPKPPQPACGITMLPMLEGKVWVYEAAQPPNPPTGPLAKPIQPKKVTIKVLSIQPTPDKQTEITLEESILLNEKGEPRTYQTKLVCTKDYLNVPPESFFYSGEPGGGLQIELGQIQRDNNSYIFETTGTRRGKFKIPPTGELISNIKADFVRTAYKDTGAKLVNGKLDLQRILIAGIVNEAVTTPFGSFEATPVQIDLRGSIILDVQPEPQTFSIPANTVSKLWFAENVGLVQVYNTNVHFYQLIQIQDPTAPPAAPGAPAAPGTPATPPAPAGKK